MKLRNMVRYAAIGLALAFLLAGTIHAEARASSEFGVYVRDEASLIGPGARQSLYQNAVWLHDRTGSAQVGVVTLPSLGDSTIEQLAVSTFREMGLGSRERNDGVLLLYAAAENRVRIEVGYGLEGAIPDGKAGAILDTYFLPHRSAGNIDDAFLYTQSAIIQEVAAEYGVDPSEIYNTDLTGVYDRYGDAGLFEGVPGYMKLLGLAVLIILLILDFKFTGGMVTFALLSMFRRGGFGQGPGGRGGRGGGGSSGGGGASR
ncbi:hypothetical protein PAE9249_01730 [Paenibacillus sp. CECT 9249]|uniref:TPM domain-containing protein n=1 Tax=Paenibacillus sp. CECT 9249 TaxID=2845385 RepID=UPI001E2AD390|nr:TPM domain-containing protein [Paenibacillus sp. CECT 9249]CAH0119231.1 hypothetical protein PAE9249_01730 [Paenibacillus sp. CECT 9249]